LSDKTRIGKHPLSSLLDISDTYLSALLLVGLWGKEAAVVYECIIVW